MKIIRSFEIQRGISTLNSPVIYSCLSDVECAKL